MFAVTLPSEPPAGSRESVPLPRWSDGAAEVSFGLTGAETRLKHLYQSDPCRVLFPNNPAGAPKEAVIVTTSGGIVGGDRLRFSLEGGTGTTAVVTTQAAEKIYRSAGSVSRIDVSVRARDGAVLEWMPQETILFDGARIRRCTEIDLAASARVLAGEIVVFGRRARAEEFTHGLLHDSWRVRRDGELIWADASHLSDNIGATIMNPHAFNNAAAIATLVYCGADAADQVETARTFAGAGAVSCLDGILIARFVDRDAAALRGDVTSFWKRLRQHAIGFPAALPRVWEV